MIVSSALVARLRDDLTVWVDDERAPAENPIAFEADLVARSHVHAVLPRAGDHQLVPGREPRRRERTEDQLRTVDRCAPCRLREAVVVADDHTDPEAVHVHDGEAGSAPEVDLLEALDGGRVCLAVLAEDLAVGSNEEGGVEVQAGPLLLEDRRADRRPVLPRLLADRADRVPGLRLRPVDVRIVSVLEHVLVVEELREDDQIRLLVGHLVDVPARGGDVLVARVRLALHLDECESQRAHQASFQPPAVGRSFSPTRARLMNLPVPGFPTSSPSSTTSCPRTMTVSGTPVTSVPSNRL